MTIKRRDFQKAAAFIREFALKLTVEPECAELRDALNLALLHMQRYYQMLRNKLQTQDRNSGASILSASLRGLSPMTPFRDAPDKFQWKWINVDSPKLCGTLPADLRQSVSTLPLIIQAAKDGDNDLIMQLVSKDPNCIYELDGLGRSALAYAIHFNRLDTTQILLEQGADVSVSAHDGSTATHQACHDDNPEALQLLIDCRVDLTVQDVHGRAPVHWACTTKSLRCLQILIDQGVDVNVKDHEGLTPSMWACRLDHIEHFGLISGVENQNIEDEDGFERDNNGRTWMHWSVRRSEPQECLKTLLTEESAQVRDSDGKTVLMTAAEQGSLPSVRLILDIVGKDCVNDRDGNSRTPLILATMGGHGELVNYLLSEGADLSCRDCYQATAWDYARARQLHYCMLILASYIRQEARTEESGHEQTGEEEMPSYSEHIMDSNPQVVVNGHVQPDDNDQHIFHGNRPHTMPHPPAQPPTPRTPRGSGPITTHGANSQGSSVTPQTARGGPLVQRSSSAPSLNHEGSIERSEVSSAGSGGSKRKKSEMESSDEEVRQSQERQGVMGHQQGNHGHSNYPVTRMQHLQSQSNQQFQDSGLEEEDDKVSIGAMDVSDLEGEGDDEAEVEPMQQSPPSHRPAPQPHPRGRQPTQQPMEYEQHHRSAYQHQEEYQDVEGAPHQPHAPPPTPRDGGLTVRQQGDQEDSSPHSSKPSSAGSQKVMPPAHLSPLPPRSPIQKPKKKKKKRRETDPSQELSPPHRGYVAPIPPPLHPHPAYAQGQKPPTVDTIRSQSPQSNQSQARGSPNSGHVTPTKQGNWPGQNQQQEQGTPKLGPSTALKPPTKKRHRMPSQGPVLEHEQKFALNEQMKATKPVHTLPGQSPRAPPLSQHQGIHQPPSEPVEAPQWSDDQDDDDWDNREGSGQHWMKGQQGQGHLQRQRASQSRFSNSPISQSGPVPAPREQGRGLYQKRQSPPQSAHGLERRRPPSGQRHPPQGQGHHHPASSPSGQGHQPPSPRSRNDKGQGVPPIKGRGVPNGRLPSY